jgi:carbohydrate kinase (thermoresistant glucokinase family)
MNMRIVVMGVSGCGKSTVGQQLAAALDARFVDGDDLHPPANKSKMAAGIPLNDSDRWPWLDLVGAELAKGNTIVACSALKVAYRDRISAAADGTFFVHLAGSRELLEQRMRARTNHFMPASLLDSQLATLEPLGADEMGAVFDIATPPAQLVEQIVARLRAE